MSFVSGGTTYTANARREVILSAGAVQTPQLLELSGEVLVLAPKISRLIFAANVGVGDNAILEPLGIKTLIDLPGVGANLQVNLRSDQISNYAHALKFTGSHLHHQPIRGTP